MSLLEPGIGMVQADDWYSGRNVVITVNGEKFVGGVHFEEYKWDYNWNAPYIWIIQMRQGNQITHIKAMGSISIKTISTENDNENDTETSLNEECQEEKEGICG